MRRVAFSCLIALVLLAPALPAQSAADKDGVRQAALDYIEGFYEGDSSRFIRIERDITSAKSPAFFTSAPARRPRSRPASRMFIGEPS